MQRSPLLQVKEAAIAGKGMVFIWLALFTIVTATALPGCGGETTGDTANPNGTGASGGAHGQGNAGSTSAGCPGTAGPSMVKLPEGYCIDSTEVTRGQYQAWLATMPLLPDSSDVNCGWKTSYTPDKACMSLPEVCQAGCDQHPQVCVDWCDAYAYCQAVGKRLCGKIGGGPLTQDDWTSTTPSPSQRLNACASGTAPANNYFPYGGISSEPGYCNDDSLTLGTTVPVGSMPKCQSSVAGYQGVYDLSGNVWEMEDSCLEEGQSGGCPVWGGSFRWGSSTCFDEAVISRSRGLGDLGFRCCSL